VKIALLFIGPSLLRFAFAAIAVWRGPGVPEPRVAHIIGIFLVVELLTAAVIIWLSQPNWNIYLATCLGLAVTAWGFCCSIVASMGLTGIWL
jgi:hypothetical protein